MKLFVIILILSASATSQWTMSASTSTAPPPPPQTGFWNGILDSSRAIDWSGAGVQGGIPQYPPCAAQFNFYGQTIDASNVQPTGVQAWRPDTSYAVNDRIADQYGNLERVVVAGTSRPDHPIWPTTVGGTVVDSTITWTMTAFGPPVNTAWQRPWIPFTNYGAGAQIEDTNGNTETAGAAGVSRVRYIPSWPANWVQTTPPPQTCDLGTDPNNCDTPLKWERVQIGGTDTDLINQALNACNNSQSAVVLAVGNFAVTYGIAFNPAPPSNPTFQTNQPYQRVVLRGAGPDKTKLVFWGAGPCPNGNICISGSTGSQTAYGGPAVAGYAVGAAAKWVGTDGQVGVYNQGSKMLVFGPANTSTCSGSCVWDTGAATVKEPVVGDMIHLDQRSDDIGVCPVTSGSPSGTGPCTGRFGATESGNTVTINTSAPHGYHVGDCVGTAYIGGGGTTSAASGYNTGAAANQVPGAVSCAQGPNVFPGWFQITAVPDSTSFQYNAIVTGLPNQGGGRVVIDTGGLINSALYAATVVESATTGRTCPPTNIQPMPSCDVGEISQHPQGETKVIQSIITDSTCPSGYKCYQVETGVYFPNYRTERNPGAWWTQGVARWLGVEDLSADMWDDGSGISVGGNSRGGIRFDNTMNSWVKNVRVVFLGRNAVWLMSCAHMSIVENYIYGSRGLQSTAYGFELHYGTSLTLLANNICQRVNACYMTNQESGDVIAYNYNTSAGYAPNTTTITQVMAYKPMLYPGHESSHYVLSEGNVTPGVAADNIHGSINVQVAFRNRLVGQDNPTKQNVETVIARSFNRGFSYVGNVLGVPLSAPGATLGYARPDGFWKFGSFQTTGAVDEYVSPSTMRWGNFDPVTAAGSLTSNGVRWCGDTADPQWTTTCSGVLSATYVSGGTTTGSTGQICGMRFVGGGPNATGAIGTVRLAATNTLPGNSAVAIITNGMNYVPGSEPTTATFFAIAGQATGCAGTAQLSNVTVGSISEVPTTNPITFLNANPVPANHTLPPSFFLPTRPNWFTTTWGTPGWPPIGPDVDATGSPLDSTCSTIQGDLIGMTSPFACNGIAHKSYMIPAQICFLNSPIDMAYQNSAQIGTAVWSAQVSTITIDRPVMIPMVNSGLNIIGVNPSTFDGFYFNLGAPVNSPGFQPSNKLTYVIATTSSYVGAPGNPGGPGTGGTVTWPNIRQYNARNCYPNATY